MIDEVVAPVHAFFHRLHVVLAGGPGLQYMTAGVLAAAPPHVASPSQRHAIEAPVKSMLVLAGPGAGKTFCLTERIRFLIEQHGFDPARICAFTFTNKAAGEIAHRLETRLGSAAGKIKRGTIHAFCAELLRQLGASVLLEPGFGIADEEYQLATLRRIEGYRKWHRHVLNRFSAHRFRGDPLLHDDAVLFEKYERFLMSRKLVDFDSLVIKAAELLERPDDPSARPVRARWDVVLVDEFQDLNPVQYRVVKALARDHKHVFAVGDDEQSIYSWAGADPAVFKSFVNDFGLADKIHLEENRRCPREVFALARKLVMVNKPIFADRVAPRADRESRFPVSVAGFEKDEHEVAWLVGDVRRDQGESDALDWGDVAVLYRKHQIGESLEAAFVNAGIPCKLAQGRALADDPIVAYVIAALRVIASPADDLYRDAFYSTVLPRSLVDEARAQAEASRHDLRRQLNHMAARVPRGDGRGRMIRRTLTEWRNLEAVGKRHASLRPLIQELLSRRAGRMRSVLDENHDAITDPAANPEVVALADRVRAARDRRSPIWMPRMGGVEIALKGILAGIQISNVTLGGAPIQCAECISTNDVPSVGIALGVFKAAQLIEMDEFGAALSTFTAVDLETTDNDTAKAEVVEIAGVRVRDGVIVDTFARLVKPRGPIAAAAMATHGITDADVADAPSFEAVWPAFRAFCGDDVIVAHNGYEFDFRILARLARACGDSFDLCTYDTLPLARDLFPTSRKLVDLARKFDIPPGQSHRALDDTLALAKIVLALDEAKRARARKTALVNLLDNLGIALALSDDATLCDEAREFLKFTPVYALGRYTTCLDAYQEEQGDDLSIPTVDDVIELLGGPEKMLRIRAERSAEERYPAAMLRLRRLIAEIPDGPVDAQWTTFLERVVLSRWDGNEPERSRVNLLTLHSTKGLEFSRVYIVGVEDAQVPGGSPTTAPTSDDVEEARRLLYVGMTRTKDRLVLTHSASRGGRPTRGHQFLDEMGLVPEPVEPIRTDNE
ncbi:MAG TPA: UvrD-helicase domain-containing protein [Gemmatimonadaceae bacterium]|nr:UvrD-helicase domain-containing protein [Gemmatimonadaceae bacterium]